MNVGTPGDRAVLWDLDGVLVDTSELHYQTWSQVLSLHSIPFNRAVFKEIFGRKNTDFLSVVFGRQLEMDFMQQLSDRKEELFRQAIRGHIQPMPGVIAWLDRLHSLGFAQAVASSAPQANVDTLIDEAGIRSYFDAVVSSEGLPGKPDPAVFLRAAEILQAPAERCLVFEDAVAGVEAARRAGMKCIAVTTSNHPEQLMSADWVISGLDQLGIEVFFEVYEK